MPEVGCNIKVLPIEVRHSDLIRISGSMYRSICPKCKEGTLLVYRNQDTLQLEEMDRCILCGQAFKYLDIEKMRVRESN